jgi:predicted acetyltransferase
MLYCHPVAQHAEHNDPVAPEAPAILEGAQVRLRFDRFAPADPKHGLVPYYHYRICLPDNTDIGHINFRIGNTPHILLAAGHIGFAVSPSHRGRSLSYHACITLAPFVRSIYPAVILTANPDNHASLRIIERLGARFVDEVAVAPDDPHYASGAKCKRRYEWKP